MEEDGITVIQFPFGTDAVSSYLTATEEFYPIIIINSEVGSATQRCALAIELDHVIQHWLLPDKREWRTEAKLFAHEY